MRNRRVRRALAVAAALGLVSTRASAQVPEKFTNLQVLPKDVSRRELVQTMRGWASALGMRCGHCHTGGNPDTLEGVDFPSDAKWEKRAARTMFRMVRALNNDYVGKLEPRPVTAGQPVAPALRVDCVTCHRGVPRPETIDAVVTRVLAKDGIDAALKTYKDLRSQFLTSGTYDFGRRPLNALGERLLDEGRGPEALPLLELNTQNNPTAEWTLYLLGEARLAAGNRVGALQAFERSLVLSPQNPRTRKRVEELKGLLSPSAPGPFLLDAEPNHSTIGFSVPIVHGMTRVTGKFTEFSATIRFHPSDVGQCAVVASIGAASVLTGIHARDADLRGTAFFDVAQHPTIGFKSSRIEKRRDDYVAYGTLSLRGISREIELPFKPTAIEWEDGKPRLGIAAQLTLDRLDYGVGNDWKHTVIPDFLGSEITIDIFLWTKLGKPQGFRKVPPASAMKKGRVTPALRASRLRRGTYHRPGGSS